LIILSAIPVTVSAGAKVKMYATRNQRDFVQQFESVAAGELLFIDKSGFLKGSAITKNYFVMEGEPDSEVSHYTLFGGSINQRMRPVVMVRCLNLP